MFIHLLVSMSTPRFRYESSISKGWMNAFLRWKDSENFFNAKDIWTFVRVKSFQSNSLLLRSEMCKEPNQFHHYFTVYRFTPIFQNFPEYVQTEWNRSNGSLFLFYPVERTFQISNCLLRLLTFQHFLKVPSCLNCPLKNNVVFSIKSDQFCTDVPKVPKVELDFRGSTLNISFFVILWSWSLKSSRIWFALNLCLSR